MPTSPLETRLGVSATNFHILSSKSFSTHVFGFAFFLLITGYTSVDHSYTRTDVPSPLITGSYITTRQSGAGTWLKTNGVVVANGTTSETFNYADFAGNTYTRSVTATNSSITKDVQSGSLAGAWPWPWNFGGSTKNVGGGGGKNGDKDNGFVGRLVDGRGHGNGHPTIW